MEHRYKKNTLRQRLTKGLAVLLLFAIASCAETEEPEEITVENTTFSPEVSEPVKRDLAEIEERGTFRMITYYSSNTYFLNQGIEVGFEYELIREFTRENDLALEVVIVGANENPFELLNNGAGDVIAANYTITPERRKIVDFTRPYNLVDQILVFSTELSPIPKTIEELVERKVPISVRRNSSYYTKLTELQSQGYDLNIKTLPSELDTEAALVEVAQGNLMATVADDNMFDATNRYMDGLFPGPTIAENDTIAWAVRSNAPDLKNEMNKFLYKHFRFTEDRDRPRRSTFLNILRQRYFQEGPQIAQYYNPEWQYQTMGIISPYDEVIKSVSDSLNVDWLMVTAMIAQESEFNPNSKSWAGAVGLMQVIPRFVDVDYEQLYDPVINIEQGVSIFRDHLEHYAYLDSTNRVKFALATYNSGMGHIADARRLAIDQNKDPNEWENVADALLKLMQRRYYQQARHGFARGIETVQYVDEIMNRYRTYETILTLSERQQGQGFSNIISNRDFNMP